MSLNQKLSVRRWMARIVLLATLVAVSCSVYETRQIPSGACGDADQCLVAGCGQHYALPKRLVRVSATDTPQQSIVFEDYVAVPDPDHHYVLDYKSSPFASDKIKVKTTASGLLDKIETTAKDETGTIILEIAKAAIRVAVGLPPGGAKAARTTVPFSAILDPASEQEVANFNRQLHRNGFDLQVRVKKIPNRCYDLRSRTNQRTPHGTSGVLYRPLRLYVMHVYQCVAATNRGAGPAAVEEGEPADSEKCIGDTKGLGDIHLLLPQGSPILAYDIRRGAFIEKTTDLDFEEGILTEVAITKPSEIGAAIGIPIEIVRSILALPSELLTFRIEHSGKEAQLYQALLAERKAREDLMEALETEKKNCGSP